ncbi:MAG: Plug domain-containing protein, partial [Candidatus Electrothrix sp. AS4_5]|nr:Plug domain-containing protein [Candidatus Electrothrix gigas]
IRGRRALMQVDGMNWYDYGYYVDTAAVPMADLEKVDVVRGNCIKRKRCSVSI